MPKGAKEKYKFEMKRTLNQVVPVKLPGQFVLVLHVRRMRLRVVKMMLMLRGNTKSEEMLSKRKKVTKAWIGTKGPRSYNKLKNKKHWSELPQMPLKMLIAFM